MAVRKPPPVDFSPLLPPDPIEAALARKKATASRQQLILRRQRILKSKGYLTGVDGNWGPVSQGAWKRYRSGLPPIASNGAPIGPPPVRAAPPSGALRRRAIDGVPDGATGSAAEAEATLKARQAMAHANAQAEVVRVKAQQIQEQAAKISRKTFIRQDPLFGNVPVLKKDLIPPAPAPDIRSVVQKRSDLAVMGMEATLTAGPSIALQEQEIRAHVKKILDKPITAWSTSDFALVYGTSYGIADWWDKPNQVKRVQRYLINNYQSKGKYFQGFQPQTKSPVYGKNEGLRVTGEMDPATGKAMLAAMAIEKRKDFLQRAAAFRHMYYMPLGIHEGDPGFPILGKAPSARNLMKILDAGGFQATNIILGLSEQLKKADIGYTAFRDQMIDEALRGTKGGKLASAQGVFTPAKYVMSDDIRVQAMQAVSSVLVRSQVFGIEGGNVPGRRGDTYTDELLAIAHAPTREAMIQAIHDVRVKDTKLWQFEQAKASMESSFWGDVFGAGGKMLHYAGVPADYVADFFEIYAMGAGSALGQGLRDASTQGLASGDITSTYEYRRKNQALWQEQHPWLDMAVEMMVDPTNLLPGAWFKAPFLAVGRTSSFAERLGMRLVEAENAGIAEKLVGYSFSAPSITGRAVREGGASVKLTTAQVLGPTWVGAAKRGLTTGKAQMVHQTQLLLDEMKSRGFRQPTRALTPAEKRLWEVPDKALKELDWSNVHGDVVQIGETFAENSSHFKVETGWQFKTILRTMLKEGLSLYAHVDRVGTHGVKGLTVFGSHFQATIASFMRSMVLQKAAEGAAAKEYRRSLAERLAAAQDMRGGGLIPGQEGPRPEFDHVVSSGAAPQSLAEIQAAAYQDGLKAAAEFRKTGGAYLFGGGEFFLDMKLEDEVQKRLAIVMTAIMPTIQDALEERMMRANLFDAMWDEKGVYVEGDSKLAQQMTQMSRDMFDDLGLSDDLTPEELADDIPTATVEIDNVNYGKVFTHQEKTDIVKFQLNRKTRSVRSWAFRSRLRGKDVTEERVQQILDRWLAEQNTKVWEKVGGGWTQRQATIRVPAVYARHLDAAWGDTLKGFHPEMTAADISEGSKSVLALSAPPGVAAAHSEVLDITERMAATLTNTTYKPVEGVVDGEPAFFRQRPADLGIPERPKRGPRMTQPQPELPSHGPDFRVSSNVKPLDRKWSELATEQNALLEIMAVTVQPHLFLNQWAAMLALQTAQSIPLKMLWGTVGPMLDVFTTSVIPLSPKTVFRNIVDNYLRIIANGHFDPRFYAARLPDEYRMGNKNLWPEVMVPEVYSALRGARSVADKYQGLYSTGRGSRFRTGGLGPSAEAVQKDPSLSFTYVVRHKGEWKFGNPGENRTQVIERYGLEDADDLTAVHVQFHRGSGMTSRMQITRYKGDQPTKLIDPSLEKEIVEKYDGKLPKGRADVNKAARLEGKLLDLTEGDISEWPMLLKMAEGNVENFTIVTIFSWGVRQMRAQLKVAMQNNPNAAIRMLDEFDRHVNALYAKDGEAIRKVFDMHDLPLSDVAIRGQQFIGDGRSTMKLRGVLRLSDETWAQMEGLSGANADEWIAALHASEPRSVHTGTRIRGGAARVLGFDRVHGVTQLQREAFRSFLSFQRDALWDTMVGVPEGTARATLYRSSYYKALEDQMSRVPKDATPRERMLAHEDAKVKADVIALKEIQNTLFDYDQVTVLEDNLRLLAPFMFYWRKTLPFWVKKMARNPWIPLDVQRLQAAHDQAGENKDIPEWMRRYYDMGWFTDAVAKVNGLNWLFPSFDGAEVGADPMNFWSGAIAYKLFKNENQSLPEDEAGVAFLADLVDGINATGLSMTPFFRKPLEWAGVLNYRAWQNAFPQTSVIEMWSRTHLKEEFPNGFNLEQAFLDPIFKAIGIDLNQGRFNDKRYNTYQQLWISQQTLLGNHPTRAEAKEHVDKFMYAQAMMGFWTSLFPRDVSPELVRLYQIVEGLHFQTLEFADLTEDEQNAYMLFKRREENPVAFNAYLSAVPKIEAYHAMEDFDKGQAYLEENPEIIPYVASAYNGGKLFKRQGYKKQIDMMVQGENAHQVLEALDAVHLTHHQEQMVRTIFVTPELLKFWAKNDTASEIKKSMERGAVHAYMSSLREQYFALPANDFKAKNEYMRQNPILEIDFQKNNMRYDDLSDPFNAAAQDYRDTYMEYADRDQWDQAAAFLKQHPWIFKGTKSEDSVTDDGIWVSKKFSAQRRKDYLAAYQYIQYFFKLRGDAKIGTKAGYAWLNSNAPGAKLVRDYFAKYGDFNGTKAQHARDYLAVKKYLVWFFDTLKDDVPFRGYSDKWEWMQESDDPAATKIRLYLRKYAKKGGSTQHARDYLAVKADLKRYFDLRKTDDAAAQAWLHSGTPAAEAVRAYFKKYGKMAKLSRQYSTWVQAQNPEINRRNLFWKRYFDLEPDQRPAFVHKNAEEYGVFIYGPIGFQERADAEAHYLRNAKAKHLSAKVALRLRIAPLLDTYYGLTDPTEKRLFERANPDMMSWLDKYGEGPMTGDKALDKKIGVYFDMEPDSNQRAEYLRNNPDVQDYFDLKNPADKAIHNTLEVYFAIEDPKKRKNYLIFHPEINNYFDRKKMEKQNLSDLTIAFDEADPRLEEYRLRMQSEIIDPAAVLYDTMRSQVASNIAGNDIVDPRSGLDPKEQKRRRRKKGVTLGP